MKVPVDFKPKATLETNSVTYVAFLFCLSFLCQKHSFKWRHIFRLILKIKMFVRNFLIYKAKYYNSNLLLMSSLTELVVQLIINKNNYIYINLRMIFYRFISIIYIIISCNVSKQSALFIILFLNNVLIMP